MKFFFGETRGGRTPTDPKTQLKVSEHSHQKRIITIALYPTRLSTEQALSTELSIDSA